MSERQPNQTYAEDQTSPKGAVSLYRKAKGFSEAIKKALVRPA